jgi:hypothetical protein
MKSFIRISSRPAVFMIRKNLTSEIACKFRTGEPVSYPGYNLGRDRTPALAGGARENRAGIGLLDNTSNIL